MFGLVEEAPRRQNSVPRPHYVTSLLPTRRRTSVYKSRHQRLKKGAVIDRLRGRRGVRRSLTCRSVMTAIKIKTSADFRTGCAIEHVLRHCLSIRGHLYFDAGAFQEILSFTLCNRVAHAPQRNPVKERVAFIATCPPYNIISVCTTMQQCRWTLFHKHSVMAPWGCATK